MGLSTQDESLCRAPTCPRLRGCRATRGGSPGRGSHSHGSGRRPGSVVGCALTLAPRRVAQRLSARRGASAHAPTASSGTEAVCLARWEPAPTTSSGTEAVCPTWSARGWLAPHDVTVARSRKRAGAARTAAAAYGRRCRRRRRRRPRSMRQEVDVRDGAGGTPLPPPFPPPPSIF